MTAVEPSAPGWRAHVPNALTVARIAAAPLTAGLVLTSERLAQWGAREAAAGAAGLAALVFVLAAASDLLDGLLARRWGVASSLGAALDHAADKVLSTAAAFALAAGPLPFDLVLALLAILLRDVAIGGLREGLSASGRSLPVGGMGKAKTVALLGGLAALLCWRWAVHSAAAGEPALLLLGLGRGLCFLALVLALLSAARYTAGLLRKT